MRTAQAHRRVTTGKICADSARGTLVGAAAWAGPCHRADECNLCTPLPLFDESGTARTVYREEDERARVRILCDNVYESAAACTTGIALWHKETLDRADARAWRVLARAVPQLRSALLLLSLTRRTYTDTGIAYGAAGPWHTKSARAVVRVSAPDLAGRAAGVGAAMMPVLHVHTDDAAGLLDVPDYAVWVHAEWWNVIVALRGGGAPPVTCDGCVLTRVDAARYSKLDTKIRGALAAIEAQQERYEAVRLIAPRDSKRYAAACTKLRYAPQCRAILGIIERSARVDSARHTAPAAPAPPPAPPPATPSPPPATPSPPPAAPPPPPADPPNVNADTVAKMMEMILDMQKKLDANEQLAKEQTEIMRKAETDRERMQTLSASFSSMRRVPSRRTLPTLESTREESAESASAVPVRLTRTRSVSFGTAPSRPPAHTPIEGPGAERRISATRRLFRHSNMSLPGADDASARITKRFSMPAGVPLTKHMSVLSLHTRTPL